MSEMNKISGEVVFDGWTRSTKNPQGRFSFRASEESLTDAFVGREGQRFMIVAVKIEDDEKPEKKPIEKVKPSEKKRSQEAHLYSMHDNFQVFMGYFMPSWEGSTRDALKRSLRIDSLSELDDETNKDLIERYEQILSSYREFCHERGYV